MPDWPVPHAIYIYRTSAGWRHALLSADSLACGRLDLSGDTPAEQARTDAEAMVAELAAELGVSLQVTWTEPAFDTSHGDIVRTE